jgi:hypothetical protein
MRVVVVLGDDEEKNCGLLVTYINTYIYIYMDAYGGDR